MSTVVTFAERIEAAQLEGVHGELQRLSSDENSAYLDLSRAIGKHVASMRGESGDKRSWTQSEVRAKAKAWRETIARELEALAHIETGLGDPAAHLR
jgi:hypothetical protein